MNIREIVTIAFAIVPAYILMIYLMVNQGHLTLERPYLENYKECQSELEQLEDNIKCPDVKCIQGVWGYFWGFIGLLFMVAGFWYHNKYSKLYHDIVQKKDETKP